MPKLKQLNAKHLKAIEKKWGGDVYQKIARDLGVSLDTVKSWFRKRGFVRKHYEKYAKKQIKKTLLNPTFYAKN